MTRMIILAGAPEPAKLDWTENSLLPLSRFDASTLAKDSFNNPSFGKGYTAQWRQLATDRLQMRPVLPKLTFQHPATQVTDDAPTQFFAPNELISLESTGSDASGDESQPSGSASSTVESAPEALIEYYEHSFSIHEAVPSSQLSTGSEYFPGTPTYEVNEAETTLRNLGHSGIIRTPSPRRMSQAPKPQSLTNLSDIPNASHLSAIEPQTMTVNLIASVLSISATRSVTTGRNYGKPRQVELVELLVGDETKSGFSVTMWLPREMHVAWKDSASPTPEGERSELRRNLKSLRIRDVVLLQNVALSSYRGKVHGQSLKGDVTKIDLLFRKKADDDDAQGVYTVSNLRTATGKDPQILKVKKVRDWMVETVGEEEGARPRKGGRGKRRALPNDTQ